MIVAGIHGDEIAGIKAAEYLKDNLEIENRKGDFNNYTPSQYFSL